VITSDIFVYSRHRGVEPKKCRKQKNGFQHHYRREPT